MVQRIPVLPDGLATAPSSLLLSESTEAELQPIPSTTHAWRCKFLSVLVVYPLPPLLLQSRRFQVSSKIPHMEPEQLSDDFLTLVNASLSLHPTHPCMVVGMSLRPGCIELVLDLVPIPPGISLDPAADSAAHVSAPQQTHSSATAQHSVGPVSQDLDQSLDSTLLGTTARQASGPVAETGNTYLCLPEDLDPSVWLQHLHVQTPPGTRVLSQACGRCVQFSSRNIQGSVLYHSESIRLYQKMNVEFIFQNQHRNINASTQTTQRCRPFIQTTPQCLDGVTSPSDFLFLASCYMCHLELSSLRAENTAPGVHHVIPHMLVPNKQSIASTFVVTQNTPSLQVVDPDPVSPKQVPKYRDSNLRTNYTWAGHLITQLGPFFACATTEFGRAFGTRTRSSGCSVRSPFPRRKSPASWTPPTFSFIRTALFSLISNRSSWVWPHPQTPPCCMSS